MEETSVGSKVCPSCDFRHDKEGIYCGRSCSNWSRKQSKETKEKISKSMKSSEKVKLARSKRVYSDKRTSESIRKQSESLAVTWKKKKEDKIKTTEFKDLPYYIVKELVYKEMGHKCEECEYEKVGSDNKGPFDIHHKDGNHNNNERNNLQVLCKNCHFFTDTYCFKGRKHTKESIKKRMETRKGKEIKKSWLDT